MKRLLLAMALCTPSWGAWSHYAQLTSAHARCGSTTSSSFPALIYGSDATLKDAGHNGYVASSTGADILVFSDSGLTTQIPSELDSYDNVNGILWIWALIDCDSSTDQTVYLAVGNAFPPSRTTGVWSNGFAGVWHLGNGTTLSYADSVGSNNGSTTNAPTPTTGVIDGGADFLNGVGNSVDLGNNSSLRPAAVTWSAWVKGHSWPYVHNPIIGTDTLSPYMIFVTSSGALGSEFNNSGTLSYVEAGSHVMSTGTWYHVSVTYSDADGLRQYVNGVIDGSYPAGRGPIAGTTEHVWFGQCPGASWFYFGDLDEVHLSSGVRSADWLLAEYSNQSAPGNIGSPGFWTWSGWRGGSTSARRRVIVVN